MKVHAEVMYRGEDLLQAYLTAKSLAGDHLQVYLHGILNPALRAKVESMLRTNERPSRFLAGAHDDGADNDRRFPVLCPSSRGTSYEIVDYLGQGRNGTVYLGRATGTDEAHVAIKVLSPFLGDMAAKGRYVTERDALQRLSHPNIVRFIDSADADSPCPFLVMEFVNGHPITQYCHEVSLPLPDRLKLAQSICNAVHDAHSRGVFHRDLKPANVLVTGNPSNPVVKIVDLGVARLADRSGLTNPGSTLGTLLYMPPEQASGAHVDARSDVYAIGALLHELLIGRTPVESDFLAGRSDVEKLQIVAAFDADPIAVRFARLGKQADQVSARCRTTPARLAGLLSTDLGIVIDKALQRDPDRRYASAHALGEDIQRVLDNQPIMARRSGTYYELSKWAQRNKLVAASMAIMVVLLGAASAVATTRYLSERKWRQELQSTLANNEELRWQLVEAARLPFQKANWSAIAKYIRQRDLHKTIDRGLLRPALEYADTHMRQKFEPLAAVYTGVGDAYLVIANPTKALACYTSVSEFRCRQYDDHHPDVAAAQASIGHVLLLMGREAEAISLLTPALACLRRQQDPAWQGDVAACADLLARACMATDKLADARRLFDEALLIRANTTGTSSADYSVTLHHSALLDCKTGQFSDAAAKIAQSIMTLESIAGSDSPAVLAAQADLARVLIALNRLDAAEEHLNQVRKHNDHPAAWMYFTESLCRGYIDLAVARGNTQPGAGQPIDTAYWRGCLEKWEALRAGIKKPTAKPATQPAENIREKE